MSKPGFKVMHVQDVDYRSTCQPFIACLEQVRQWSRAHPDHVPIFILVETKQGKPRGELHLTEPEPFTSSTFDALDAEIRSVFPANEMITPDDVRGHYDTLNEAVLAGNWPSLASARGKVVFLMDQRTVGPVYLDWSSRRCVDASLHQLGRRESLMPLSLNATRARRRDHGACSQGLSDSCTHRLDTKEARTNDTTVRDAMMASGAQLLSTDYPVNEPARWPGNFVVTLPDKASLVAIRSMLPPIAMRRWRRTPKISASNLADSQYGNPRK